jgi:hypothetical protein
VRRRIEDGVEEADGRGEPGRRDGGAGSGAAARGRRGGRWRLKEHLTCGSHMSGREREGEEAGDVGPCGPEDGWAAGLGRCCGFGLGCFVFFSFFSFSVFFSNPFQTLLNSNLLHVFKLKF